MGLDFEDLLGEHLLSSEGTRATAAALEGKTVGLYFSAHWCPPCRAFTPVLVEYYRNLLANDKAFEIVFISIDHNAEAFQDYFKSMPWLAFPFDRTAAESLGQRFQIKGVPTLIFLDQKGEILSSNGRANVLGDPEGLGFPYPPKSAREILGTSFVGPDGQPVSSVALDGKTVGVLIAKASHPLQDDLAKTYKSTLDRNLPFEIIALSDDHLQNVPWLTARPKEARRIKAEFCERLGIDRAPHLVVIGPDEAIINHDALVHASSDTQGELFPWHPKNVVDIAESFTSAGHHITHKTSLIAFFGSASEKQAAEIERTLQEVADRHVEKMVCKDDMCVIVKTEPQVLFFTSKHDCKMQQLVRQYSQVPPEQWPAKPFVLVINAGAKSIAVVEEDINHSNLQSLIDRIQSRQLSMQKLAPSSAEPIFKTVPYLLVPLALHQISASLNQVFDRQSLLSRAGSYLIWFVVMVMFLRLAGRVAALAEEYISPRLKYEWQEPGSYRRPKRE